MASPRRGRTSSVTFDQQTFVRYASETGSSDAGAATLTRRDSVYGGGDDQLSAAGLWWNRGCRALVEKKAFRVFYRVCALANVLSLFFSAPLLECTGREPEPAACKAVFIQFTVIACVDFVLCVVYTLQTAVRVHYAIYLYQKAPQQQEYQQFGSEKQKDFHAYISPLRLLNLFAITASLWWSLGIGIYRSIAVQPFAFGSADMGDNPVLYWAWYIPFIPRSLAIFSSIKLVVHLRLPSSALLDFLKKIKWKQLGFVALFYLFFVYLYALVGVHWIGALSERCMSPTPGGEMTVAIPFTHCSLVNNDSSVRNCFSDKGANEGIACVSTNESGPLQIQFRNTVYLGQFRFILDALCAVYEASSWELWSFMEYASTSGGRRLAITSPVFYLTLVLFLVVFVQQSIFLVVIIESFADLRSEEAFSSAPKPKNKPLIVLYEQPGLSDEKLRLRALKVHESSTNFQKKLRKWYFCRVEKLFLVLVIIDAIVTSATHLDQPDRLRCFLVYFQLAVSILFCLEIAGVFAFHLCYSDQYKLFFRSPYYWYLIVLAVGGLVASVPELTFSGSEILAVFQALRLPRALRLFDAIKRFMLKTIGDGSRLLVVLVITLVFLMWFSVVSMQFFGYLDPQPECLLTGADQFSNILLALESIFQLAMQEGWTQLMSEMMCHRDIAFAFVNLYFIGLHLFASLILLNFFVAVILDNLDYEEDEKREKLEEDLKTKSTGEKVPLHLQVFKCCGQRRVRAPKISSVELPNLTEADVRNFYNTEDVDYPSVPYHHERLPSIVEASLQRPNSELSQLELLSEGRGELLLESGSQRGKYWGVQGILSYVKAFRQHSRELENSRPLFGDAKSELRGGTSAQLDSVQLTQSEYDEYREKYRLFDSALFCMPPENRFRRACKFLLTSQLAPPTTPPLKNEQTSLLKDVFHKTLSGLRYVVSRLPYFGWLVVVVTAVTLGLQISELQPDKGFDYYWLGDLFFVAITFTDLMLKVFANGLFLNPHAAISTVWDVLDWLILLATLTVMLMYTSVCGASDLSLSITFRSIPDWLEFLLVVRALRPLRIISLLPSMRRVISDVLLGWRNFGKAVVILFGFVFMFASFGVQLFTSTKSSQGFCNDPMVSSADNCMGEFNIFVDISQEKLPSTQQELYMLVPRVWYPYRRDFRFDHIGTSLLTLFEVLTTEGWVDLREMFTPVDESSLSSTSSWLLKIYLHLFIFFGVNFGLQLFVGIVVNNFNEHKPDHSALLTVSQKRWTDLMHRISLTRPIKLPPEPRQRGLRWFLYKMVVNRWYRHISSLFIFVNSWLLCAPWLDSTPELKTLSRALISISLVFAAGFVLETMLKIVAFGRNYFQSFRNVLDGLLSLLSVVYIACGLAYLIAGALVLNVVTDIALVLAALKFVTILTRYSTLQNLLTTVGTTILNSLSLLGVIGAFIITYAFVGVIVFSPLRSGEAIDYNLVSFNGVWTSINLVIRVMTGEDWHQLLWDSMTQEPYCSQQLGNCGNQLVAILWFLSYYIFVPFILLNVVIAVLLENFSIFYNEDDTALSHAVVKDFKYNWKYFDSSASGAIAHSQVKLFLRMLKLQSLYTLHRNLESGLKVRRSCSVVSNSLILREMAEELLRESRQGGGGAGRAEGGAAGELKGEPSSENLRHNFQSVLKMLAYRAEDISRRLVPQELYVREELEESVQFDVAEACILDWMQRFVKPVVLHQQRTRRKTIVQPQRRLKREETVIWGPSVGVAEPEGSWEEGGYVSCDTEEEGDRPLAPGETDGTEPLVTRSYQRLRDASYKHFDPAAREDKWHDWFRQQQQWMDHVERDPENYFDDCL